MGRKGWGERPRGESNTKVPRLAALTSSQGANALEEGDKEKGRGGDRSQVDIEHEHWREVIRRQGEGKGPTWATS